MFDSRKRTPIRFQGVLPGDAGIVTAKATRPGMQVTVHPTGRQPKDRIIAWKVWDDRELRSVAVGSILEQELKRDQVGEAMVAAALEPMLKAAEKTDW